MTAMNWTADRRREQTRKANLFDAFERANPHRGQTNQNRWQPVWPPHCGPTTTPGGSADGPVNTTLRNQVEAQRLLSSYTGRSLGLGRLRQKLADPSWIPSARETARILRLVRVPGPEAPSSPEVGE